MHLNLDLKYCEYTCKWMYQLYLDWPGDVLVTFMFVMCSVGKRAPWQIKIISALRPVILFLFVEGVNCNNYTVITPSPQKWESIQIDLFC